MWWLITFAFEWTRTAVAPALLACWQIPNGSPLVVYPGEFVEQLGGAGNTSLAQPSSAVPDKRPLFILLDGTWAEAGKMFRKSPYLDGFPMLSLNPDQPSRYKLRRFQAR